MTLKMFRAAWFLSVLVVLVNLLYVYASLPEPVVIQESDPLFISREWFFYVVMLFVVAVNFLVYLMKMFVRDGEDLRSWFHGFVITINIFTIVSMHALNVYNSGEVFDHSRISVFLTGSLALTIIWAVSWPIYRLIQKFFVKQVA